MGEGALKRREQQVVFQVDVLDQVFGQTGGTGNRACQVLQASAGGLVGQFGQPLELRTMADMFVPHPADGEVVPEIWTAS